MPRTQNEGRPKPPYWQTYGQRLCVSAAFHPLEYAKILMQIGHEPIPPVRTTNIFGREVLALPNSFQYVAHIKSIDGFLGCWQGVVPKLGANLISGIVYDKVYNGLKPYTVGCLKKIRNKSEGEEEEEDEDDDDDGKDHWDAFFVNAFREFLAKSAAIIASQPLHVIAVRTMAQFVGKETKYTGLLAGIGAVKSESGIFGFFYGIVPRIMCEMCSVALASAGTYIVNAYVVQDKEVRSFVNPVIQYVASMMTYPFQVVASCIAVSASGLAAAQPPYMPVYTGWLDCYSHLRRTNQMKRGGSVFMRYYTGPYIIVGGDISLKPVNFTEEDARRLFPDN